MNPATCTALATVIPVLLLGVALEGRSARARLRIRVVYAVVVGLTIAAALGLIAMVVVGLNRGGISDELAVVAWVLFWLVMVGTLLFLMWLVAGFELEARETQRNLEAEEKKASEEANKALTPKPGRFDFALAAITGKLKR